MPLIPTKLLFAYHVQLLANQGIFYLFKMLHNPALRKYNTEFFMRREKSKHSNLLPPLHNDF